MVEAVGHMHQGHRQGALAVNAFDNLQGVFNGCWEGANRAELAFVDALGVTQGCSPVLFQQ